MAKRKPTLGLHEQLLLLALRDRKGTPDSKAGMYMFALGGAILSELLLEGCITVADDKKKLVDLARVKKLHDPVLDEALDLVASAKRRRSASSWVTAFARIKGLRHRVAERLCRRGILEDSASKVLLFFTRKVYPTINPTPEKELLRALRRAIFENAKTVDPRTGILVALANSTGLLRIHFEKKRLKERKRRIDQIVKGDLASEAAGDAARVAAQAAQAAALTAVMVATTVTTVHH